MDDGGGGGCFNIVGSDELAIFGQTDPLFVADIVLELVEYLFNTTETHWTKTNFRKSVAELWDRPLQGEWQAHHLLAQHLITGAEQNRHIGEYAEVYERLVHCPYLGFPVEKELHVKGEDSIHGSYEQAAIQSTVDLTEGLYRSLAKLSPKEYLQVSLTAFQIAAPDHYQEWVDGIWVLYNRV